MGYETLSQELPHGASHTLGVIILEQVIILWSLNELCPEGANVLAAEPHLLQPVLHHLPRRLRYLSRRSCACFRRHLQKEKKKREKKREGEENVK